MAESLCATVGLDLYLVDETGRGVVAFPDRPGLTMEQTYHYVADRDHLITVLADAGMLAVTARPAELRQAYTETTAAFAAREDAWLRDCGGGDAGAGIAGHKLHGDDAGGWWVTASECRAALATAATVDHRGVDAALVEFLARAAEYGGFRVWTTW
ncbi:hypothetical protein [Nocardia camponoti]|uniref:Uncharacterized protein n=1 Tax=Nocardia camponoti TaxID=1616106 RepID=A0A917QUW3_9NOCA|nr:hypothetical protein [Nocardia camponoti]GGK69356.1 hypothetical protein GCM10011591_46830 [Nocardia camponoti]